LSSGSYINLDVYQTGIRLAMVLSGGEIVTTILDLNAVNNPDRVDDVTAERFTAPSSDHKTCPSVVTANCELYEGRVHEDADCGSMRRSLRGSAIRTPQGCPRGETESRFLGGMPGQRGRGHRSRFPNG
jgi:hypothetical protein